MHSNKQTIWKVGIGLLLAVVIAYIALPAFRSWILAASPTLLLLLCPLSMLFCMKMMHGNQCQTTGADEKDRKRMPPNQDVKRG